MILVSGATATVRTAPAWVGRLVQPQQRNLLTSLLEDARPWALDNAAFSGFDATRFLRMLDAVEAVRRRPLWVAVPDVVGDAAATRRSWDQWAPMLRARGLRLAYVLQDGTPATPVPWSEVDAVFVGGSTAFKCSRLAVSLAAYGRALGKWVHMGRVNSQRRWNFARRIGCHSIDGSSFSWFPDIQLGRARAWHDAHDRQPELSL